MAGVYELYFYAVTYGMEMYLCISMVLLTNDVAYLFISICIYDIHRVVIWSLHARVIVNILQKLKDRKILTIHTFD